MDWKEIEGKMIGRGYIGYEELLLLHMKDLEAENKRLREAIEKHKVKVKCKNCERLKRKIKRLMEQVKLEKQWGRRSKGPLP
jgi:hypothetical protein